VAAPKVTPADEFLRQFEGSWDALAMYTAGGRFTVAWSAAVVEWAVGKGCKFRVEPADGSGVITGSVLPGVDGAWVVKFAMGESVLEVPTQFEEGKGFRGQKIVGTDTLFAKVGRGERNLEIAIESPLGKHTVIGTEFATKKP
jgi:hypothetical protein